MSVPFSEDQGSPFNEGWQEDGVFRATRRLRCRWDDRLRLISALRRGLGQPYPWFPLARVRSAVADPFEARNIGHGAQAAYEDAIITAQYATPRTGTIEAERDDQLLTERLSAAGEFLSVSPEDGVGRPILFWDQHGDDPLGAQDAPGKLIRMLEYEVTRFEVEQVPAAAFELVGRVNESAITALLLDFVFAPETLLYNDPEFDRATTDEGAQRWTKRQSFTYNPNGWNRFFNPRTSEFQPIYDADGNEKQIYTPDDLTAL